MGLGLVVATAGVAEAFGFVVAVAFAMTGDGDGKTGAGVGVIFFAMTIAVGVGETLGDAFRFCATVFVEGVDAGVPNFEGGVATATFGVPAATAGSTRINSFVAASVVVVVIPAIGTLPTVARPALARNVP